MGNSQASENSIAVRVQVLYLLNLMIIPGLAFIMIWRVFAAHRNSTQELTRSHVSQAFIASIVVGLLIVCFVALMLVFGSADDPYTWMWIVLYFTCVHALFILLGVIGLVRAFASQTVRYPILHDFARKLRGYEVIG